MNEWENLGAGPEIYPMPGFPTLSVSNLAISKQFYVEGLGFQVIFSMPPGDGPKVLEHLRWVRYADLLLEQGPRLKQGTQDRDRERGQGVRLNFSAALAGRTCAEIAERARAHGGGAVKGPVERPYNAREVVVTDPDGFVLVFVEPMDMD
ncbi:MAG TPA: VOC family protein, partial [Anaerolineae bacterium]|nr:VOC family protein [Anaerolineae bacterium]